MGFFRGVFSMFDEGLFDFALFAPAEVAERVEAFLPAEAFAFLLDEV